MRSERTLATRLHDLLRDARGAAAIEAAFILPLVILLSFGAMETARAVAAKASINHAVKETARYAAVRGDASGSDEATESFLKSMAIGLSKLPSSSVTADVDWDPNNLPGGTVIVKMEHIFVPVTLPFLPDSLTLSSTASMTVMR